MSWRHTLSLPGKAVDVVTAGRGLVAVALNGVVVIADPATGKRLRTFEAGAVRALAFSLDDETLAMGLYDGTVRFEAVAM